MKAKKKGRSTATSRKTPARQARLSPVAGMSPLSDRALKFAHEYLKDLSVKGAAIRAGYSAASAKQAGYKLMQDDRVQAVIEQGRAELMAELKMERDTIAREMAALGFASMGDYIEIDADGTPRFKLGELTPAQLRAIQEIVVEESTNGSRKVRLKLHDKRAALVDLAKLLGFHREVHLYGQASGQIDTPVVPWIVQPVAPAPGAGPR